MGILRCVLLVSGHQEKCPDIQRWPERGPDGCTGIHIHVQTFDECWDIQMHFWIMTSKSRPLLSIQMALLMCLNVQTCIWKGVYKWKNCLNVQTFRQVSGCLYRCSDVSRHLSNIKTCVWIFRWFPDDWMCGKCADLGPYIQMGSGWFFWHFWVSPFPNSSLGFCDNCLEVVDRTSWVTVVLYPPVTDLLTLNAAMFPQIY